MLLMIVAGTVLLQDSAIPADVPHRGDTFQISRDVESSERGGNGSTATTSDRDTLIEQVVAVGPAGVELIYDFAPGTGGDERESNWRLPVHVLRPPHGPLQLLDRAELVARVDKWLKRGGLTRQACGHWIFTWNVFKIDCDPQSALDGLASYTLSADQLRDGALYHDPDARDPSPLKRLPDSRFSTQAAVDVEKVREGRIQSDLVFAEISRKPLTLEQARLAHAADVISGTVTVTFETNSAGVLRRTRVEKLEINDAKGTTSRTVADIVERRPLPKSGHAPVGHELSANSMVRHGEAVTSIGAV